MGDSQRYLIVAIDVLTFRVVTTFNNLLNFNFPGWLILETKLYFISQSCFRIGPYSTMKTVNQTEFENKTLLSTSESLLEANMGELASGSTKPEVILRSLWIPPANKRGFLFSDRAKAGCSNCLYCWRLST